MAFRDEAFQGAAPRQADDPKEADDTFLSQDGLQESWTETRREGPRETLVHPSLGTVMLWLSDCKGSLASFLAHSFLRLAGLPAQTIKPPPTPPQRPFSKSRGALSP